VRRKIVLCLGLMSVAVMAMPASFGMPAIGSSKPLNLTLDELDIIKSLDFEYAWDELEYLSGLG
jgi:hypothetical protein